MLAELTAGFTIGLLDGKKPQSFDTLFPDLVDKEEKVKKEVNSWLAFAERHNQRMRNKKES